MVDKTPWAVRAARTEVSVINVDGNAVVTMRPHSAPGSPTIEQIIEAATVIVRLANDNATCLTVRTWEENMKSQQRIPNYDWTSEYLHGTK